METIPLEVYSSASNHAVVRVPGRRFPGSVIQGDTLSNLCDRAEEVVVGIRAGRIDAEIEGAEAELLESLATRLLHYQQVLETEHVELPAGSTRALASLAELDNPPPVPVEGWIYDCNLRAFIEAVGWLIEHRIDADEWTALRVGVAAADAEASRWYEYSLPADNADSQILLRIAPDVGSSVVHVKMLVHFSHRPAIEQSIAIFQRFRIAPPAESA